MGKHLTVVVAFVLLGYCCGQEINAECIVDKSTGGEGSPPVEGTITLKEPASGDTEIKVSLRGFSTTDEVTKHGFHIHEYGNLTNGCLDAGSHYNPFNKYHGAPDDLERHVGDLGNLEVKPDGTVEKEITDRLIKLKGDQSVIGKSFVIHANEDDLGKGNFSDSLTSGHAGPRIACCEIKETKSGISEASCLTSHFITYILFFAVAIMW